MINSIIIGVHERVGLGCANDGRVMVGGYGKPQVAGDPRTMHRLPIALVKFKYEDIAYLQLSPWPGTTRKAQ